MSEVLDPEASSYYAPAVIALAIPVGFLALQSAFQYGWLEMAVNGWFIFWPGEVAWLTALIIALRRRHWWALLSAPLALYPLYGVVALAVACASGNCL